MVRRTKRWAVAVGVATYAFTVILCATSGLAAEKAAVLFVGDSDNHVASGLRALQVPFDESSVNDLVQGEVCLFDYGVLVLGMDVGRTGLESIKDAVAAFVEVGGAVLCFRSPDPDPWLPVSLEKDRAYALGEVLVPEHPIFTTPHRFDRTSLQAVHGGSIYAGFYGLGDGWKPLLSAGKQQAWDKTPSVHGGDHYGIVELRLGRGRILMCQMIPAYAWFNDAKGDANSPGARFFENLVHYALASAHTPAGPRKPRVRPDSYVADLGELMQTPRGWDRLRLDDPAWQFTAKGPFTGACDRRGVFTISYGKEAAQAGNYGQVSRRLPIPEGARRVMLRVYQTDDYCGGQEPKMVGDERVSTSLNRKEAYRFRQVLVDNKVVDETDVLGRNVQPARDRIRWYDITEMAGGKREVTLALKVVDRKDTGEETFPTDCFFACVDLRTDFVRLDAKQLAAEGYAETNRGMALSQEAGSLSLKAPVPEGRYVVAFCVLDHPFGQGQAKITVNGQTAVVARASADDHRFWWLTTPPMLLAGNAEVTFHAQGDGEERMAVSEVAFVPADLCAIQGGMPVAEAPVFKPGVPAEREVVELTVCEPAGAARTGEVASQAVPFGMGRLRSPDHLAVTTTDGKAVPSQVRPFAFWPDGSIQSAVVTFPADVRASGKAKYELHFGKQIAASSVAEPLAVKESQEHFRIDTGRLQVEIPRKTGAVVSAASIDGKEVLIPNDRSWGLELETEDGRLLRSDGMTAASCVLAERGPLRAIVVKTGKLADDAGEVIDYRYELHFTRGSAEVRFFPRFSNVVHSAGVFVKRLSLELPWQTGRSAVYYAASENGEPVRVDLQGAADLYQHTHDTLTIAGDGVRADARLSRAAGRLTGWTLLDGPAPLKVGLRYAWEMYPKRMRIDNGGLAIDLVPPPLTDADIPEAAKQVPEVADRPIGGVGYPQALGRPGLFRLAVGESIGHELWLSFGSDDRRPVEEQFAAGLEPLRAWADPAYVAGTRVFCEFHPTDPAIFPRYEKAVDGAYEVFMKRRRDRKQYGMENFGDDTFEWGYGPSYTFWSNQEDDRTHGMLMQYVRSGDLRWWDLGEQAARHYRDVDLVAASPDRPGDVGGPIHHNSRHFVSKGWVADHTRGAPDTGHSWSEGLVDYWLLTGDLLAGEAVVRMGDWYVGKVDDFRFGAGSQERGQGWALTGLTAIYRATGDPRYLDAAKRVQDWVNQWQDPVRGVISVPISEQPSYEGGTTFMHGIVGHGVARLYEVTGDPQTLRSLQGIADWVVTEPMGPPGQFWYKQAPSLKRGYSYNGKAMSATSYAYALTGDTFMAEVTDAIFSHISPDIRSMPFLTPTLAHLARWRTAATANPANNSSSVPPR
ncbi:MAG: hypothetical protein GXX96_04710 [Planctomycetaceae bacterium]|nr:hypothetical protein [Planctomycetaceae bacterium]